MKTRTNINLVGGSSSAPVSKPKKRKMMSKSKGRGKAAKATKTTGRRIARSNRQSMAKKKTLVFASSIGNPWHGQKLDNRRSMPLIENRRK